MVRRPWRLVPPLGALDDATGRAAVRDLDGAWKLGFVAGLPGAVVVAMVVAAGPEWITGPGSEWTDPSTAAGRLAMVLQLLVGLVAMGLAIYVVATAVVRTAARGRLRPGGCSACGGAVFRFTDGREVCTACDGGANGVPTAKMEENGRGPPRARALGVATIVALSPAAVCAVLWLVTGWDGWRKWALAVVAMVVVGVLSLGRARSRSVAVHAAAVAVLLAAWVVTGDDAWSVCVLLLAYSAARDLGLLPSFGDDKGSARDLAQAPVDPAQR